MLTRFHSLRILLFLCTLSLSVFAENYSYLKSESPYTISGNTTINVGSNDTFTIEEGVEIRIENGVYFRVSGNGDKVIKGSEEEPVIIGGVGFNSRIHFEIASGDTLEHVIFNDLNGTWGEYLINLAKNELYNVEFNRCDKAISLEYLTPKTVSINNCTFRNFSKDRCIAVVRESSAATWNMYIQNCLFENLSADLLGFSGSFSSQEESYFVFRNNKVKNCTTGMSIPPGRNILISNNLFWNNKNFSISAYNFSSNQVLTNNIFYGNSSSNTLLYLNTGHIANCIFWKNDSPTPLIRIEEWESGNPRGAVMNCILPGGIDEIESNGGYIKTNNLYTFDPMFDFSVDSSFQLSANSPAIDAGIDVPFYNDQDGSRNDLGIYGGGDFFILPWFQDFGLTYKGANSSAITKVFSLINLSDSTIEMDASFKTDTFFYITAASFPVRLKSTEAEQIDIQFTPGPGGLYSDSLLFFGISGLPYNEFSYAVEGIVEERLSGQITGHLPYRETPYRIDHLTVPDDDTLFIDPGVILDMEYNDRIFVNGVLICGDKNGPPVTIKTGMTAEFFIELNNANKQSIIQNTTIQVNNFGYPDEVSIFQVKNGSSLILDTVTLSKSTIQILASVESSATLSVKNSSFYESYFSTLFKESGGSLIITNNIINNNRWTSNLVSSDNYLYMINNTLSNTESRYQEDNPLFTFDGGVKIIKNNIFWPLFGSFRGFNTQQSAIPKNMVLYLDYDIIKSGLSSFLGENFNYQTYPLRFFIDQIFIQEPQFKGGIPYNFELEDGSVGINQGDPGEWFNDPDNSINDIGFQGGTGLIKPVISYNAFWHLNNSFYWLQTLYGNLDIIDSISTTILDLDENILSTKRARKIYKNVYNTPVLMDEVGTYIVKNTYHNAYNLVFDENILLIIGTTEPASKRSARKALIEIHPDPSATYEEGFRYLAWTKDRRSVDVISKWSYDNYSAAYMVYFERKVNSHDQSVYYQENSTSSFVELETREEAGYYVSNFMGNGRYFLAKKSVKGNHIEQPHAYNTIENWPNPFNSQTTITFSITHSQKISITIFDVNGKEVLKAINNQWYKAGSYIYKLNASHLSSGIYFYLLKADKAVAGKMLLVK